MPLQKMCMKHPVHEPSARPGSGVDTQSQKCLLPPPPTPGFPPPRWALPILEWVLSCVVSLPHHHVSESVHVTVSGCASHCCNLLCEYTLLVCWLWALGSVVSRILKHSRICAWVNLCMHFCWEDLGQVVLKVTLYVFSRCSQAAFQND